MAVLLLAMAGPSVTRADEATEVLAASGDVTVGGRSPKLAGWTLSGERLVTLESMQRSGAAAVVVSFFATWCQPCREGLPRLQALADRSNGAIGLLLVAVGEEGPDVTALLRELGVTAPAVGDRYLAISTRWGCASGSKPAALPRTVVVGADSVVRAIFGKEGDDFVARVEAAARDAGGSSTPAPTE